MSIAYLALGSNLGDSYQTAQQALQQIAALPKTQLLSCSSFYRSKPLGPQDQNDFLNAVLKIETALSPFELLQALQKIEIEFGRERKQARFGPRTLDLDILLFDDLMLNTETLTLPHYDMMRREFVLYPLYEIAPDLIFPSGQSLKTHLKAIPKNQLKPWN